MIAIALFEDNPIHRNKIQMLLDKYLTIPHTIDTYSSAKKFLSLSESPENQINYEIVFMDIELGEDSGITLAQKINKSMPNAQIIYISQYLEYISSVYESQHMFFIRKDAMETYLPRALEIALKKIQEHNNLYLQFFWNKEEYQIKQTDIIYIERVLRTTEIHTSTKTFYTSEKIGSLQQRLNNSFIRCHRSYIINMNALTNLKNNCAILNGTIETPISRSYYKEVKKRFNLFISTYQHLPSTDY